MHCELTPKQFTRRKRILTAVKWGVALLLMIALAVFNYYLPLRSLLPATKLQARAEGGLRVHILSVGQADCSVVEFPNGELLVIDGGNGSWQSRNDIIKYMKGLDVQNAPAISYVVTHADGDHYGGIEELIRLFGGENLYLPVSHSDNGDYAAMLKQAKASGLQIDVLSRYNVIKHSSGAFLSCLSPRPVEEGDGNALSTVLYLDYLGNRALFCGDMNAEREELLYTEYQTDNSFFDAKDCPIRLEEIDFLKVAHHGSASSSSEQWLSLLKPKNAVVSCGAGNAYSHPALKTLITLKAVNADCEIYRTDELGNVVATFTNSGITVHYDGLE